eukprot:2457971-Prymnesium_polylepis.1
MHYSVLPFCALIPACPCTVCLGARQGPVLRARSGGNRTVPPDLGLAFRARPGMTQSSGADCSAPAISPCPLR